MLNPSASRRTPLKKAPSTGARCHPKVKDVGAGLSRSLTYVARLEAWVLVQDVVLFNI